MEQQDLRDVLFADENPEQRALCCVLADCSASMQGEPIDSLNRGLVALRESLADDPIASTRVEICVVAFNDRSKVIQDWTSVSGFRPPRLTANGTTHLGSGISTALDQVRARTAELKHASLPMYRPWLILLSDGLPYGEEESVLARAEEDLRRAHRENRLIPFPVGVGEGADLALLERISAAEPRRLEGLAFEEFFFWVSASLSAVTASHDGTGAVEGAPVDVWARIPTD